MLARVAGSIAPQLVVAAFSGASGHWVSSGNPSELYPIAWHEVPQRDQLQHFLDGVAA